MKYINNINFIKIVLHCKSVYIIDGNLNKYNNMSNELINLFTQKVQRIKTVFLATVFALLFISTLTATSNYNIQRISNQDEDSFSNRDVREELILNLPNLIAETNANGVNIEEEAENIMPGFNIIATIFCFSIIGGFLGFTMGVVLRVKEPFSLAFIGIIFSAIVISLKLTWRND